MASYIRTKTHLLVVFDDGTDATVYPSNPNFDAVVEAVNQQDWDAVRRLSDPAHEVKQAIRSGGIADRVDIKAGIVHYDGEPLHNTLTERMLAMIEEGLDVTPLALFLQNLMENTSFRAVKELYGFLEHSNLPITEDGHFLAYKRIRKDWMDQWSGTVDNSIGQKPEMPRNEVDEDASNTCSNGLHFCSRSYLPKYGSGEGGRIVVVKINPRDVVAIPKEHHNEKGRCCRYEVINEIQLKSKDTHALPKAKLEGSYQPTQAEGLDRVLGQFGSDGNLITTFATPREAQKMTGIDSSSISKVARGVRNSAGGYGWKYMNTPTETNTQLVEDRADNEFDPDDYQDDELWK